MRIEVAVLPLLFLVECHAYAFVGKPHYIETGHCEVITYSSHCSHRSDEMC